MTELDPQEFDLTETVSASVGGAYVQAVPRHDTDVPVFDVRELFIAAGRVVAGISPDLALSLRPLLDPLIDALTEDAPEEVPVGVALEGARAGEIVRVAVRDTLEAEPSWVGEARPPLYPYDAPEQGAALYPYDAPEPEQPKSELAQVLAALTDIQSRLTTVEQGQQADAVIADGEVELPPYTEPQPRPQIRGVNRRAQGEPGLVLPTNRLHPVGE